MDTLTDTTSTYSAMACAALQAVSGTPATAYAPITGLTSHVIVVPDSAVWITKGAVLHYMQVEVSDMYAGRVTLHTDIGQAESGANAGDPVESIADRIALIIRAGIPY